MEQTLIDIKNNYVKTKADEIIESMTKRKELTTTIATCDYSNWDREYHRMFPQIATELRKRGFSVSSTVNHGVTDWVITA
jgi:hypothetical protein